MDWPAPTRSDHDTFCRTEGWHRVRDARGRTGTHHITYEYELPDGRILRTRISRPPDRSTYGPRMWKHILRDQLQVDEDTFWACVHDGTKPDRGQSEPPADGIPAEVVHLLLSRVGLTESHVAGMSRAEAIGRLQEYWTSGR